MARCSNKGIKKARCRCGQCDAYVYFDLVIGFLEPGEMKKTCSSCGYDVVIEFALHQEGIVGRVKK